LRIAICEDERQHADILTAMVNKWAQDEKIPVDLGYYQSAEEFLFHWPKEDPYDLAFLDIQLDGMSGMQLAQCIRKQDQAILLVFTTGLKDMVFRGYDVQAFHYLLKPIREKDCKTTLSKAMETIKLRQFDAMIIPTSSGQMRVHKNEIYYIEVDDHFIVVHTKNGDFRFIEKLSTIEQQVSEPHFCKCHRSHIVNMHFVKLLQREHVILDNDVKLSVSRSRRASLNRCFASYYRNHSI
jgi:DNA-binding LytR/AlgR family response regulator